MVSKKVNTQKRVDGDYERQGGGGNMEMLDKEYKVAGMQVS